MQTDHQELNRQFGNRMQIGECEQFDVLLNNSVGRVQVIGSNDAKVVNYSESVPCGGCGCHHAIAATRSMKFLDFEMLLECGCGHRMQVRRRGPATAPDGCLYVEDD